MYWAVTYSLRPLNTIADNLSRRTIFELDPVVTANVPHEIKPIIAAFNSMLERVRVSIQNERQFTSNAAHELRTPLAGIKLHAQLAETTSDEVARQRFTRGANLQGEGSGLGLAIVEKIASLHQAQLRFMNLPNAGLRVEIVWPNAARVKS
jgi:signal transduction histidine kinase